MATSKVPTMVEAPLPRRVATSQAPTAMRGRRQMPARARQSTRSLQQRGINRPGDVAFVPGQSPPQRILGGGTVRVHKSELFATAVTSSADGTYQGSWSVNPANELLFPWMSSMSPMFTAFVISNLRVNYYHTCSVLTIGSLVVGFLYDGEDDPTALDYIWTTQLQGSVVSQVANNFSAAYSRERATLPRYMILNAGRYVPNRMSVPAWICIAGSGISPNTPLGNLEIEYDIDLIGTQHVERPMARHAALFQGLIRNLVHDQGLKPFGNESALTISAPNATNWITWDSTSGLLTVHQDVRQLLITYHTSPATNTWDGPWGTTAPTSWSTGGSGVGVVRLGVPTAITIGFWDAVTAGVTGTNTDVGTGFANIYQTGNISLPLQFGLYCNTTNYATDVALVTFVFHIVEAINV